MKRFRRHLNTLWNFSFAAFGVLCILKLLFNAFKTTPLYTRLWPVITDTFFIIAAIAGIQLLIVLFIVFFLQNKYNKSFDRWMQENKSSGVARLLDTFSNAGGISFMILHYQLWLYLALVLFGWPELLILWGISIARKFFQRPKSAPEKL